MFIYVFCFDLDVITSAMFRHVLTHIGRICRGPDILDLLQGEA